MREPDLIRRENGRAGATDWLLARARVDPATRFRCPWIEGYCSRTSVAANEAISFHVSTDPPSPFVIDLYRMGYYGGSGARHLRRLGPYRGRAEADPEIGPKRLRECRWPPCATIEIPRDWPSGVILGKLTAERDGAESYLIFVVRDDREADFVFQCSDLTWQAYNRWPDRYSLYDDGEKFWAWGPDADVSFDRPYAKYSQLVDAPLSTGSGEWLLWEFPLAYWMEREGYDVTYVSSVDTHRDPMAHARAAGFLSVGHDEYYTMEMFTGLQGLVARGVSLAFFSGNTCCGLVGLRASSTGAPDRIVSRLARFGGSHREELEWFPEQSRLPASAPRESELVGGRTTVPATGTGDWICTAPDHWVFAGTDMRSRDAIRGLVGWEYNGEPADIAGLEIVSSGPTKSHHGEGVYAATVYPGPHGNFVFNAATCWWSHGVAAPPGHLRVTTAGGTSAEPDVRAQRITANVLERMRVAR
ncbi:MAG TPA: N,N-dimethylformamidase beta subunit family domain-containing protein [Candidatus Binatia bacterium]|nr:N,N-dimethylformamidase beta subunit family domain-containing protein [Candidatus Binatia bacterium]